MEKISWNNPSFGEKELKLVKEVLESGYVSEGPKTRELEEKLSRIVGTQYVIMTTSCTAALYLAIEAYKRIEGYNSDVNIPNLTFVGTKNAVEMARLPVKFVDVQDRYLINNQNSLFVPVNLLGRGCKIDNIHLKQAICDNAGCLGSKVPNGIVGCYSLQANKILSCGQGGFCATDDERYATMIRKIKDFGRENKEQQNTVGFNFKFNDIQAAVALGQLEQLEERKKLHINQYLEYKKNLKDYGGLMEYKLDNGEVPLWIEFFPSQIRGINVGEKDKTRDELFDYLKEKGIGCRKPWTCFNQNKLFYPKSIEYQDSCVWLPNGIGLSNKQQKEVIKEIKNFYDRKTDNI